MSYMKMTQHNIYIIEVDVKIKISYKLHQELKHIVSYQFVIKNLIMLGRLHNTLTTIVPFLRRF